MLLALGAGHVQGGGGPHALVQGAAAAWSKLYMPTLPSPHYHLPFCWYVVNPSLLRRRA